MIGILLAVLINFVTDLFPLPGRSPLRWWLLAVVLVITLVGVVVTWRSEVPPDDGPTDGPGARQVIHEANGPVVGEISGGVVTFHPGSPPPGETGRKE